MKSSQFVKVRDVNYNRISRELDKMKTMVTKVGFPNDATPSRGELDTMTEVATIAAVHEFGAPNVNIPERSFLRSTFDEQLPRIIDLRNKEYEKIMRGESTVEKSLGLIGEYLTHKTKKTIRDGIDPENSPATIVMKGSSKPLIDTAQTVNSITHVECDR